MCVINFSEWHHFGNTKHWTHWIKRVLDDKSQLKTPMRDWVYILPVISKSHWEVAFNGSLAPFQIMFDETKGNNFSFDLSIEEVKKIVDTFLEKIDKLILFI